MQIDAPEAGSSECYCARATAALEQLLPPGRRVRLAFDPRLDRIDRYGRQLAYVFKGQELIQQTLVTRGAASPWSSREIAAATPTGSALGHGKRERPGGDSGAPALAPCSTRSRQ